MPSYKLSYFPARGKAEAIRFMFHLAGVPFEETVVTLKDWPKLKPEAVMGQLPMLEVDGKRLSQSMSIARYLAEEFKLVSETFWDQARADMLVDGVVDCYNAMMPIVLEIYLIPFSSGTLPNQEKLKQLREEFKNGALKTLMDNYMKLLAENGTQWFVGSQLTWADIVVAEYIERVFNNIICEPSLLKQWPELKKHQERVFALPNISAWVRKRPSYAV